MPDPPENPPDDRLTQADRLSGAPALLWIMMGLVAVAAFVGLAAWLFLSGS